MELYQASKEWTTRPNDERFWTLDEMHAATVANRTASSESVVDLSSTRVVPMGHKGVTLELGGSAGDELFERYGDRRASLTNWSFGQLSRMIGAPAKYLQNLPSELAASCIEEGLRRYRQENDSLRHSLVHMGESPRLKAMTSDRYRRVWNDEIVSRLGHLHAEGWRVAPARPHGHDSKTRIATKDDVIDWGVESALSIMEGDTIAPAGLYASDHDMFAFMVNPEVVIDNGLNPHGMRRGTMIRQSEVGECSIWKLDFLFDMVCGNHIVWGATNVSETRIAHKGDSVQKRWQAAIRSISDYAYSGAREQEQKISKAQTFMLGSDRDEVVDFLFGKRMLSRRIAREAYDLADDYRGVHGDPRTAWGIVSGLTRLSQKSAYADKRTQIDITAGKILSKVIETV